MTAHRVPVLTFELAAKAKSIARARRSVLSFARQHSDDEDLLDRVALAFSEAFTNAVRHAYAETDGEVRVCMDVDEDALEIVVIDDGCGFRSDSSTGGLGAGMTIIAECADAIGIRERRPSGTEVWMRFELP